MANKFIPVKGTDAEIKALDEIVEGRVYVASDTGTIYADLNGRRMSIGGSGSGGGNGNIRFAQADAVTKHEDGYYHIKFSELEDQTLTNVPVDTVVINKDGAFYRVKKFENDTLYCDQIAVSGGGGGSTEKIYVELAKVVNTTDYINGESAYATITPHSGKNSSGQVLDDNLSVTWSLCTKSGTTYTTYYHETVDKPTDVAYQIDFGKQAKQNETSYLFVEATGINSGISDSKNFMFNMVELSMEADSSFANSSPYSYDSVIAAVNVVGNLNKIIEYYFDDELIHTEEVGATFTNPRSCKINTYVSNITHGYHTVKVRLYQSIQGEKGIEATPVQMEIAVDAGGSDAIIWFDEYASSYYAYDDISIPYHVYNPANKSGFSISLLKDNAEVGTRTFENLTDGLVSANYEITDADAPEGSSTTPVQNNYGIGCGETRRDITFMVAKDPDRDMELTNQLYLKFNFDAKGHSNDQSLTQRTTLDVNGKNATFSDFNWYNNGWVAGTDSKTCLRISNGASLSLPIGAMTFGGEGTSRSHTFEMQFRIRNVQNYDSLITNITRYKNDTVYYNEFYGYISWKRDTTNKYDINSDYFVNTGTEAEPVYEDAKISNETDYNNALAAGKTLYIGTQGYKTNYTNYDAFLKYYCDLHGLSYDDVTANYDYTEKRYNLSAIVCGFYSGKNKAPIGFGLGPQDVFFTNGTNTVNANYVENKLVNVSIVYNHDNKLMSIYVNGILTGVLFSTLDTTFTINNANIVFNSTYCDIDLYKFRIYDTALSINDIGTNYAVDLKDVKVYDQNKLAILNKSIDEFQFNFANMVSYNKSHPSEPVMPYIVYDTSENEDDRLSWSKKTKVNIKVEFVNTVLDSAYQLGELDELAAEMTDSQKAAAKAANMTDVQYYYAHHCPSWEGDVVEMAVQGTSSEFYPRRNYKLKTKDSDGNINMNMHKGPFEENVTNTKWFYMDNYSVGTTKFTMKIDFMESSGSYNRGLGNLLKNAYSKHPLDYYAAAGALSKAKDVYNENTNDFDATTQYYYYNHKGNVKAADGTEDNIPTLTAETFAQGPVAVYTALMAADPTTYKSMKVITDTSSPYYNKWYVGGTEYEPTTSGWDFTELRTQVQGFPVLAFHKFKDGTYTYIGRYNMLIDKGSDEEYGFKNDDAYLTYLTKKDKPLNVKKKAECWEYENNSRGFCSFRDPLHRKFLSFNTGSYVDTQLAPGVVEDYEYRFNVYADDLDILCGEKATNLDSLTAEQIKTIKDDTGYDVSTVEKAQDALYDIYGTWEKTCQWVWSTALDSVIYQITNDSTQKTDKYYYILNGSTYSAITNLVASESDLPAVDPAPAITTYYCVANKKKYDYDADNKKWVDSDIDIYESCKVLKEEEIANLDAEEKLNYLLKDYNKVSDTATFDSSKTYYKYVRHLYVKSATTEETFADDVKAGLYTLDTFTKQFIDGGTIYTYDSYEYRYDKFKYELTKHFNFDYLATYFVVTETLELYDSRGKNAMMASWGPMEKDGDWIWFPIFYDMDTQLGINNTGIPSFDYAINATEDGTFSTNDSILWKNFYTVFYNQMVNKYCQLRGQTEGIGDFTKLDYAPFTDVDRIEAWYESDPDYCKSISMRGVRPLSAINLDEYYKYISITNTKVGYQDRDGGTSYDAKDGKPLGTYFYALQGDRSLSRRQFLTNRINYLDSWMTVMSYARGGKNVMRGRITANNLTATGTTDDLKSDKWVENTAYPEYNSAYWTDSSETVKTHQFDGEYWVTMSPSRKSYVTLGEDGQNYGSKKYDGSPVKFVIDKLENGIRTSANYNEQLTYFYGADVMQSYGNLNNLYFTELYFDCNTEKMTDLILGWDGLDENNKPWYNHGTNMYTFMSMPLLKEVNLSNLQYKSDVEHSLDFSGSQKLQNFRATGSNFTQIKFAEGVALNTLYLPTTATHLQLTEAKQLKNVITNYQYPTLNTTTNKLVAEKGLYIEKFTDYLNDLGNEGMQCNIQIMSIINAENLGYDAYKLANGYYYIRNKNGESSQLAMTNVKWTPYNLVDAGSVYSSSKKYYVDNFHCGLNEYTYSADTWDSNITNGILYVLDETLDPTVVSNIDLFENLVASAYIKSTTGDNIPNITGTIYIDNDEALVAKTSGQVQDRYNSNRMYTWSVGDAVDEYFVRNILGNLYPNAQFFFKTLAHNYTARFILLDEDDNKLFTAVGTQTVKTASDKFDNPISIYGDLTKLKENYDFYGWADKPDAAENEVIVNADLSINNWDDVTITSETMIFYAIFSIHKYLYHFYDGNNVELSTSPLKVPYNTTTEAISEMPNYPDGNLGTFEGWKHDGWSLTEDRANLIDVSSYKAIKDRKFYAVFTKIESPDDIRNYPTDGSYFDITDDGIITLKSGATLTGKVVIPKSINDIIVTGLGINFLRNNKTVTHVLFEPDSQVNSFGNYTFANSSIIYVEPIATLRTLNVNVFANCSNLTTYNWSETNIVTIADNVFSDAFDAGKHTILMPASVQYINQYAFAYYSINKDIEVVQFGEPGSPSQITSVNANAFVQNGESYPSHDLQVYVYCSDVAKMNEIFKNVNIQSDYLHIVTA